MHGDEKQIIQNLKNYNTNLKEKTMYLGEEKNIYIYVNGKEAEQINEILGTSISKDDYYATDLNELETLKDEGFLDEDLYEQLDEEVDVTDFIIAYT
jgi:hypothetical protein